MFTFGDQVYRLTARDEETLLVEPFLRKFKFNVNAAAVGTLQVPLQADRAFYLDSVVWRGNPVVGAGATWDFWQVTANIYTPTDVDNFLICGAFTTAPQTLQSDGTEIPQVVNTAIVQRQQVKFVFPPGYKYLNLDAGRRAGTVPDECQFWLSGYYIPPGRIGRQS